MYDELVKALRETRERVRKYPGVAMYVPPYQLSAAVDAIEELVGKVEQLPRWIPVTEGLPKHLTSVIVHRKDGGIFMWEYFDTSPTDECWIDDSMNVYSFYDVTHWMPLPEPPKEEA